MAVTRDEAKLYLRIDNDVEDALIDSLIQSSTTTVENVLRHPLSDYTTLPEDIKTAILYVWLICMKIGIRRTSMP